MIYIYKKTYRTTGLKYLGKTTQDPYKYRGSGTRWTNHIRKHGNNVETEILKECQTLEEVKNWGIHFSNLWNIVESDEWANLKPEYGEGGSAKGIKQPTKGKTYEEIHGDKLKAEERKQKHKDWMLKNAPMRGKKISKEVKKNMSDTRTAMISKLSDEERKKLLGHNKNKPWSDSRRKAQELRKLNKGK